MTTPLYSALKIVWALEKKFFFNDQKLASFVLTLNSCLAQTGNCAMINSHYRIHTFDYC